jgi:arylsulfatase I/J
MVKTGLELNRHYVHKICSPTRSAVQSGRAPIHVNVQNVVPESVNPKDPVGGFQGIPLNMTCIASQLKKAQYKTHLVGKWDCGMATMGHTPWGRGYDSFLGYFHHANDYWTHEIETCKDGLLKTVNEHDLWMHNSTYSGPAHWLENDEGCNQQHQNPVKNGSNATCVFEEEVLTARVKQIIAEHDGADPLFLFWSMHLVHMPLQVSVHAL